jgi:hypothetical protein
MDGEPCQPDFVVTAHRQLVGPCSAALAFLVGGKGKRDMDTPLPRVPEDAGKQIASYAHELLQDANAKLTRRITELGLPPLQWWISEVDDADGEGIVRCIHGEADVSDQPDAYQVARQMANQYGDAFLVIAEDRPPEYSGCDGAFEISANWSLGSADPRVFIWITYLAAGQKRD